MQNVDGCIYRKVSFGLIGEGVIQALDHKASYPSCPTEQRLTRDVHVLPKLRPNRPKQVIAISLLSFGPGPSWLGLKTTHHFLAYIKSFNINAFPPTS